MSLTQWNSGTYEADSWSRATVLQPQNVRFADGITRGANAPPRGRWQVEGEFRVGPRRHVAGVAIAVVVGARGAARSGAAMRYSCKWSVAEKNTLNHIMRNHEFQQSFNMFIMFVKFLEIYIILDIELH